MMIGFVARLAITAAIGVSQASATDAAPVKATINAGKVLGRINPLVFGQFTENANSNFYRGGLWAEMLEDRKFYYPIVAITPATVPTPPGPNRVVPASPWHPVGNSLVIMDTQRVFSGKQSAGLTLDVAAPHGIRQGGLAVERGRAYSGRIVLASDPGAEIQVDLVWGSGPADRQTVKIAGSTSEYRTFPLAFTSGADSRDAAIEIIARGRGVVHLGAVSLMPADNVEGWRADSVRALQEIGPTIIRYGGNFVSDYDWSKGVGDRDQRPSTFDFAWNQMDPNDVGTDEILTLTGLLKAEPYMNVNAGFGDAKSAAEWLEYVNGSAATPMGKLRAANGHAEPYKVRWWNIGNEMYGPWQLGQMQIRQYVAKHNAFAAAMREVDPSITIVAVGADPAEMNTTRASLSYGKPIAAFGSDQDWNSVMLTGAAGNFDLLSEHLYPKGNQAFDADQNKFVPVEESRADHARRLPNRVKMTVESRQEYQRRFPGIDMKKIQIALDEWVPGNPALPGQVRDPMYTALSSAEALHEMFRNSDWFVLSNFTHLTGLVTGRTATTILPIGRVFQLYRRNFGTLPVEVVGDAPQHDLKGVLNVDKPNVSSGSATYPIDVAAAWTADHKTLTIAVVNPTEIDQQIDLDFAGVRHPKTGKLLRIVAPASLPLTGQATRRPQPVAASISETPLARLPRTLTIPKQSISMYLLPAG